MQTGFHKPVRFAMTLVIDVSYFAAGYLKAMVNYLQNLVINIHQYWFV